VRVAFGTDEITPTTDAIVGWLRQQGHEVSVLDGTPEWPEVGRLVATAVVEGRADRGIVCCWTGTGVSIAANKVPGVRAALCPDAATAAGARRWNDANVLALGLRLTTSTVALEAVEAFLATEVEPSEAAAVARLEGPRTG
jgi:ribose 5-phosphate isomerase B